MGAYQQVSNAGQPSVESHQASAVVLEGIDIGDRLTNELFDVIGARVADGDQEAFRWRSWKLDRLLEVVVFRHEDMIVVSRPFPDGGISGGFEGSLAEVRRVRKLIVQSAHERMRKVLVEEQPQAVAVRARICSAA